jgi:outer membrane protein assembly factor BamB
MPFVEAQNWDRSISGLGTFSSPRVADLNGDGTDDIVLGAGREEFLLTDSGVIAIDGRTGQLLWHIATIDQMFGSAIFQDINGDSHPDVLISGRSSELIMIDGYRGKILWKFNAKAPEHRGKDYFNFYNPQWIDDQDGDQLRDILVSNGGDVKVAAYDPNRKAGYLMILSAGSGKILSEATMPDGKETYMSVTVSPCANGKDWDILYGTGGETLGGNLFVSKLSDLKKGDLTNAKRLDSAASRGYIGPAARADINGDGITEVILNSVDGRMIAFDGTDYHKLWEIHRPSTETYSSIAVGRFTDDTIPDFFASYAMGSWPNLDWSTQFMADGRTGKILYIDSLGFYQNSSGIVVDWNGDGRDEVLLSVNFQEIRQTIYKYFFTMLVLIDFTRNEVVQISDVYEGNNISATPWLGDLDHDGLLDIIYVHGTNARHNFTFDGFAVHRIETQVPAKNIRWGAYQGSDYTGIYRD